MNTAAKATKLSDLHVRIDNVVVKIAQSEKELDNIISAMNELGMDTGRLSIETATGPKPEPRNEWLRRLKQTIVMEKYDAMRENALAEKPAQMRTKSRVGNFFSTVGELIG
jgi:hypothetical protein